MKTIQWLGTITSIIGAFSIAFGYAQFGYCNFLVGSIAWLYVGIKEKNMPMIVLNGTFFVANLIGAYRAFF